MTESKYPEVRDLRERMKHYEFRRDDMHLMLIINRFQIEDDERLRFTLSPCFNHVMMVMDKGEESTVQWVMNLYPPIRSQFTAHPQEGEEFIYEYEYGLNAQDGGLMIKFKIVSDLKDLRADYWSHFVKRTINEKSEVPVVVLKEVGAMGYRERFEMKVNTYLGEVNSVVGGKAYEWTERVDIEGFDPKDYDGRDALLSDCHRAAVEAVQHFLATRGNDGKL